MPWSSCPARSSLVSARNEGPLWSTHSAAYPWLRAGWFGGLASSGAAGTVPGAPVSPVRAGVASAAGCPGSVEEDSSRNHTRFSDRR